MFGLFINASFKKNWLEKSLSMPENFTSIFVQFSNGILVLFEIELKVSTYHWLDMRTEPSMCDVTLKNSLPQAPTKQSQFDQWFFQVSQVNISVANTSTRSELVGSPHPNHLKAGSGESVSERSACDNTLLSGHLICQFITWCYAPFFVKWWPGIMDWSPCSILKATSTISSFKILSLCASYSKTTQSWYTTLCEEIALLCVFIFFCNESRQGMKTDAATIAFHACCKPCTCAWGAWHF